MIVHVVEVGSILLAAFVVGCVLGAQVFALLARSRFADAQWATAEAIARVGEGVGDRLGVAGIYRVGRRGARPVARPVQMHDDDPDPVWEVIDRAVAEGLDMADEGIRDPRRRAAFEDDAEDHAPWQDESVQAASVISRTLSAERQAEEEEFEPGAEDGPDAVAAPAVPVPFRPAPPAPPRSIAPPQAPEIRRSFQRPQPPVARPTLGGRPPLLPTRADDTAQTMGGLEMRRPAMLSEPRNGVPDNLQRIRGIGERNEVRLNMLGIFHFSQIASWTPAEIRWIGQKLAFPERIERDDWVGQAITLASGGETGFTKSADRRRARRSDGGESDDEVIDET